EGVGRAGVHRLQPDVLPAVHPRVSRDAAALPRLPGGVSGAERAVHRRGIDPRRRLSPAPALLLLVAALRRGGIGQSVGRNGAGVADDIAAPDGELRAEPGGHGRPVRLPAARATRAHAAGGGRWLTPPHPSTSRTTSTTPSSNARPPPSGCGCSWSRRSCSSAACSPSTSCTGRCIRTALRTPAITSTWCSAL